MEDVVAQHRRACDGFLRTARAVPDDRWSAPTPCTKWDAYAVVEHVIGFHDFLLLRPLGVRAHRPRDGAAARWEATSKALFGVLQTDDVVDDDIELLGGATGTPRRMLPALTTDVLVHTWDVGTATGVAPRLDLDLCREALARIDGAELPHDMYARAVAVGADADPQTRLVATCGRDPMWTPPWAQ